MVILVLLDIVYVSVSFSRNKFNHVWPLHVLRSIVSFIVTVLFMPVVGIFISFVFIYEYLLNFPFFLNISKSKNTQNISWQLWNAI